MKNKLIVIILICVGFFGYRVLNKNKTLSSTFPQEFLDDRTNFGKVNQLFGEAMDLTKPPDDSGEPFTRPKDQENLFFSKLEEGIYLSNKIDNKFLDFIDPNLNDHFRNEYVRGNQLILEGSKSNSSTYDMGGVKKQFEGNQLIETWNVWWIANRDRLTEKAYPVN